MKVVTNTCFGGFGLSPRGTKRLAELQGRKCYFFHQNFGADEKLKGAYSPMTLKEAENSRLFFTAFDIPNPNEVCSYSESWHSLSEAEKEQHNNNYSAHSLCYRDIDRADPLLIQVVEELGGDHRQGASGHCAELTIVEIPDGVEYEIEEYDGNEHVAEKHRTWR